MPLYNSGAGMDMSMGGSYDQVQRPQARSSRLFGSPAQNRQLSQQRMAMSPGQGVGPPNRYNGNTSLSGPAVGSFSRGPSDSGQARTGKIPMKGEQQVWHSQASSGAANPSMNGGPGGQYTQQQGMNGAPPPVTPGQPNPTAASAAAASTAAEVELMQSTSMMAVTVYGFPPQNASFILKEFEKYGTIIKKHIEKGGNWMHLQYSTENEARKALNRAQPRTLQRTPAPMMIGVCPCTDQTFVQTAVGGLTNQDRVLNTPLTKRPARQPPRALGQPTATPGTPAKAAPQQGGFLTVAREYVLGW